MKRRSYLITPRGGFFSSAGKLIAAVLAVMVLLLFLVRLTMPQVAAMIFAPLWGIGNALTDRIGGAVSVGTRASLIEDRERLMREIEAAELQNAKLTARVTDLERLLGGRTERTAGVLAGVLARPPTSPYDVLIVDQGSEAGVRVGNRVTGPGGIPLGTITSSNTNTSRVTLYSHTGNVTEGWAGESRIPMKLTGTGAGGYDAEIPGTAGALVGDQVYVPGPGALPIGVITEVVSDPSSPSVVLRIRPYINPFSLTWVSIVP